MPNVFSHPYQLDETISNIRVAGWYFYSNFKKYFCKRTVENLFRRAFFSSGDLALVTNFLQKDSENVVCCAYVQQLSAALNRLSMKSNLM